MSFAHWTPLKVIGCDRFHLLFWIHPVKRSFGGSLAKEYQDIRQDDGANSNMRERCLGPNSAYHDLFRERNFNQMSTGICVSLNDLCRSNIAERWLSQCTSLVFPISLHNRVFLLRFSEITLSKVCTVQVSQFTTGLLGGGVRVLTRWSVYTKSCPVLWDINPQVLSALQAPRYRYLLLIRLKFYHTVQ
jgi:hypothetical protein